jgi:hypothetical protein
MGAAIDPVTAFVITAVNMLIENFLANTVISFAPWNDCSNYDELRHQTQAHLAVSLFHY